MMTDEDLRWKLCVYDERNPFWQNLKGSYEEGEDKPAPNEKGCACDNCFYGRSEMAREILEVRRFKKEWGDRFGFLADENDRESLESIDEVAVILAESMREENNQ